MAPPKTTGKGKPAITLEEKAAEKGLSIPDYKKRSMIGIEMREHANSGVGKRTTGVKTTPTSRSMAFFQAWEDSRAAAIKKYGIEELKRLKINYKGTPPSAHSKVPKKKKKSSTGKKGAVKKA